MCLLMQARYVASYLWRRSASHLLLCDAAGCCKGLCKAGVLIRHVVRHRVQIGHWQGQVLRHCALHSGVEAIHVRIHSYDRACYDQRSQACQGKTCWQS